MTKVEDDVYNFGFILLESLVGPIVNGKGEAFLLNEMVCSSLCLEGISFHGTLLSHYLIGFCWLLLMLKSSKSMPHSSFGYSSVHSCISPPPVKKISLLDDVISCLYHM